MKIQFNSINQSGSIKIGMSQVRAIFGFYPVFLLIRYFIRTDLVAMNLY